MAMTPAAIIPAAGASRRMGRPKLLLPYGRRTVLGALINSLHEAGAAPIVVVAAAGDTALRAWCAAASDRGDSGEVGNLAAEEIMALRGGRPQSPGERDPADACHSGSQHAQGSRNLDADASGGATAPDILGAVNPAPERGMLSSILAGLAALGGGAAVSHRGIPLLVTPGDLPALRAATVIELLRRRAETGALLAVPTYHGSRGHPLLIAPDLAGAIEHLDAERGLRHLLDLHPGALLAVEVDDPGCVADLDTPEDYHCHQRLAP